MKRRAVSSRAAAEPPDEPLDAEFLERQSALEVIFERLPHALTAARHLQSKEVLASLLSLALALQEQDVESHPLRGLR